jgi:hypothetical protein
MIFSVKNNCSGIAIFPAVWEGHIFMETGVHQNAGTETKIKEGEKNF